jgi:hydroxymethylbilane synthase
MNTQTLTIATRESPLALAQATMVKQQLLNHFPYLTINLLGMTTQADQLLSVALKDIGGKGLFVKELEQALISGQADLAVHSMKDVPMSMPQGLIIAAILKRESAYDAFVCNAVTSFEQLPIGSIVGTSSLRRQTQLQAWRNDLQFQSLRGNVNTRLKRLDDGHYSAIILAAAGLHRLHLAHRIQQLIPSDKCLPAAGQGAIGVECRQGDEKVINMLQAINDGQTAACVNAERVVCRELGGNCQVPIAAYAVMDADNIHLQALVANHNGSHIVRATTQGPMAEVNNIGKIVASELIAQGAQEIINEYL